MTMEEGIEYFSGVDMEVANALREIEPIFEFGWVLTEILKELILSYILLNASIVRFNFQFFFNTLSTYRT